MPEMWSDFRPGDLHKEGQPSRQMLWARHYLKEVQAPADSRPSSARGSLFSGLGHNGPPCRASSGHSLPRRPASARSTSSTSTRPPIQPADKRKEWSTHRLTVIRHRPDNFIAARLGGVYQPITEAERVSEIWAPIPPKALPPQARNPIFNAPREFVNHRRDAFQTTKILETKDATLHDVQYTTPRAGITTREEQERQSVARARREIDEPVPVQGHVKLALRPERKRRPPRVDRSQRPRASADRPSAWPSPVSHFR